MTSKKTFIRKSKKKTKVDEQRQQPDAAMRRDLEADAREHVAEAREEANRDIASDADLSFHNPADDLDEGETARLSENDAGIV